MAPVGFSGEEVGHSRVVCTQRCLGFDVENDPLKCETLKINPATTQQPGQHLSQEKRRIISIALL